MVGPPKKSFLLPSQKNDLLRWLQSNNLDPLDFTWTEDAADPRVQSLTLLYRQTSYYFEISVCDDPDPYVRRRLWSVSGSPGSERHHERYLLSSDYFDAVQSPLDRWAFNLRREADAPDLWGQLMQQQALQQIATEAGAHGDDAAPANTLFTEEEIARLDRVLDEAPRYLEEVHGIDEQQKAAVATRMRYLAGAARRLLRLDWANIAVAQAFSMLLDGILPDKAVRDLLGFFGSGLKFAFTQAADAIQRAIED